jgi:hypothetical protein
MKRPALAALLLLSSLSACSGSGQSNSVVLPQGANAPLAPVAGVRDTLSASVQLSAAPLAANSNYRLYVANAVNNSITVYNANASGNTAPIATIAGSKTQLKKPGQLSEDANGNLYVANVGASSILVFAHGANGNVAPVKDISGPLTGLSGGLITATADQTTGRLFAVAGTGQENGYALLRFPLNANGDQTPLATTDQCCNSPAELTSDSTGKEFIYASHGVCCSASSAGIYTGEKFKEAHPAKRPSINNFGPGGVVDDPTTKTFLVSGWDGVTQGIFRFQEDTVGHGSWDGGSPPPPLYTPAVVSVITGDSCGPRIENGSQLALGYDRSIYMAQSTSSGCAADAVYVYEHDASGNATPLRVLTGPATKLDGPTGIYEGK